MAQLSLARSDFQNRARRPELVGGIVLAFGRAGACRLCLAKAVAVRIMCTTQPEAEAFRPQVRAGSARTVTVRPSQATMHRKAQFVMVDPVCHIAQQHLSSRFMQCVLVPMHAWRAKAMQTRLARDAHQSSWHVMNYKA